MEHDVSALNLRLHLVEKIRFETKAALLLDNGHGGEQKSSSEHVLHGERDNDTDRMSSAKARVASLGLKKLLAQPLPCENLNQAKLATRYESGIAQNQNEVLAPRKLDLLPSAHPQSPIRVLPSPKQSDPSTPFRFSSTLLSLEDVSILESQTNKNSTKIKKDLYETSAELESLDLGLRPEEALELAKKMIGEEYLNDSDKISNANASALEVVDNPIDLSYVQQCISSSLKLDPMQSKHESIVCEEGYKIKEDLEDDKTLIDPPHSSIVANVYETFSTIRPEQINELPSTSEESKKVDQPSKPREVDDKIANTYKNDMEPSHVKKELETAESKKNIPCIDLKQKEPFLQDPTQAKENADEKNFLDKDSEEPLFLERNAMCVSKEPNIRVSQCCDPHRCVNCCGGRICRVELNVAPLSIVSSSSLHPVLKSSSIERRFDSSLSGDYDEEYFEDQRIEAFINALKRDCLEDYMNHISKARSLNPSVSLPRFEFEYPQQSSSSEADYDDKLSTDILNVALKKDHYNCSWDDKEKSNQILSIIDNTSKKMESSIIEVQKGDENATTEPNQRVSQTQKENQLSSPLQIKQMEFESKTSSTTKPNEELQEGFKSVQQTSQYSPSSTAILRPSPIRKTTAASLRDLNSSQESPTIPPITLVSHSMTPTLFKPVSDHFLQPSTDVTVELSSSIAVVPVPIRASSRAASSQQSISTKAVPTNSPYYKPNTLDQQSFGKSTPLIVATEKDIETKSALSEESTSKASILSADSIVFVDTPDTFVANQVDSLPPSSEAASKSGLQARIDALKELLALETEKMKVENLKRTKTIITSDDLSGEGKSIAEENIASPHKIKQSVNNNELQNQSAKQNAKLELQQLSTSSSSTDPSNGEQRDDAKISSAPNETDIVDPHIIVSVVKNEAKEELTGQEKFLEEVKKLKKNINRRKKTIDKVIPRKAFKIPIFRKDRTKNSTSVIPSTTSFPVYSQNGQLILNPAAAHQPFQVYFNHLIAANSAQVNANYLLPFQLPLLAIPSGQDFHNNLTRDTQTLNQIPVPTQDTVVHNSQKLNPEKDAKESHGETEKNSEDISYVHSSTSTLVSKLSDSSVQSQPIHNQGNAFVVQDEITKIRESICSQPEEEIPQPDSASTRSHVKTELLDHHNRVPPNNERFASKTLPSQISTNSELQKQDVLPIEDELDEDELDKVISVCSSLFQTVSESKNSRAEMEQALRSMLDALGPQD